MIKLNAREWWIIIIGLLGAAVNGSIWPLFALLFGEILEVFARPADEILDSIHLWAGLFIVLGIVSGTGVFLKVCTCSVNWSLHLQYSTEVTYTCMYTYNVTSFMNTS